MKTAALLLAALVLLPAARAAAPAPVAAPGAARSAVTPPSPPPIKTGDADLIHAIVTNDILTIDVYQEDDLRTQSRVNANGRVNLNLVKEVKVAGLTVIEAQQAIEKAYRDGRFLRKPQVTIHIVEYAERTVSIQGDVNAPNRYSLPIEATMSVADLVMKAGGLKDTANGRKVRITHFNAEGKAEVREVDVHAIIKGETKVRADDKSLMLEPGDIVFVPMNWI
jgi:polysaccharide export outer membrane protein